jgi:competence protein ComGC
MDFIKDIWDFLKTRKKFWLLPAIIVLLVVGVVVVVGGSTAIAPFIYTVF